MVNKEIFPQTPTVILTDMSVNTVLLTWPRWFTGSGSVVGSGRRSGDN